MKKILLATTLIAASTGYAAAEVAVTGTARMGVVAYNDALGIRKDAEFSSRIRIKFVATGETDNGLSFGASVRNDQSGVGNTANGDSTVYLSGAFGKVTMGDTGNASDNMLGQVSGVGFIGVGDLNEIAFLAQTNTGVMYEYSAGAVSFGIGAGQTTNVVDDPLTLGVNEADANNFMSAAVKYSTDAYMVGLAYETNDGGNQTTLMGSTSFSGATVKAKFVDSTMNPDLQYALSVDYAMSGVGITAFYADHGVTVSTERYGIGASYDLGGGASVAGGIAREKGTDTQYELGVNMSF